ncbi:MAG TPA: molybdate ABC transporter substrate-binding protein [Clostridia bacterium]|nr:molybdate ABC transporter substrate-binding protein [Clostridia bacterium]
MLAAALLCHSPAAVADQLTVAAASDLTYALKDLSAVFQAKTGHTVKPSLGSSGSLFAQISNGAPYDVFLSADADFPSRLISSGLADAPTKITYARGVLVLWIPSKRSPLDARLLLSPSIRKIAVANPQHAPYGRAAVAALRKLGIYDQVAPKLVYGENVSQAAQFVDSGSAQAGLIAASLLFSSRKADGHWSPLPANSYPQFDQVGVVLKNAPHQQVARAFLQFLSTEEARAIFARHGFIRRASELLSH